MRFQISFELNRTKNLINEIQLEVKLIAEAMMSWHLRERQNADAPKPKTQKRLNQTL